MNNDNTNNDVTNDSGDEDTNVNSDNIIDLALLNPWEFETIFSLEVIHQIRELAKYSSKNSVKLAIFGHKEFSEMELEEFNKNYSLGAAEGEITVARRLYIASINGDTKCIDKFLTLKNNWGNGGKGINSDGEEDVSGILIELSGSADEI